jgi:hydrogenase expression/formation protein HypC
MCLAVPGRITYITDDNPITRRGRVDFGGISREIHLAFVPDAGFGDYVMVHVGFAITQVDEDEANRVFDYLEEIGGLEELGQ